MQKNLIMKGFVIGILLLFFGAAVISAIDDNIEKKDIVITEPNDYTGFIGLDDGLVGYWSFDEGSGSIAYDESENGNDGMISGASWVDGISGSALDFDGVDDYVDISDVSDFQFTDQSVTFALWVQIVDNADEYRNLIVLGDTNDNYPNIELVKARSGNNGGRIYGQLYPTMPGGTYATAWSIDDGDTLPKNEWLFLTLVIDYENSLFKLYLNGVFQDSDNLPSYDLTVAQSLQLNIGRCPWQDPWWHGYHNGCIDEARIYDRALSEDEIQELYNDPFKMSFIFGRISNLNTGTGNRITFEAEKIRCIQFSPFQFIQYSSHEEIMVLDKYLGILNPNFIFGFFRAVI